MRVTVRSAGYQFHAPRVVSEAGVWVGIISSSDILKWVAGLA